MSSSRRLCTLALALTGVVGASSLSTPALGSVSPEASVSRGPGFLQDVVAVSANNVWAVGSTAAANSRTLVKHWNGSTWQHVRSLSSGRLSNTFQSVDASSATNVWAAGSHLLHGTARTLIEHRTPAGWRRVFTPNPGGALGSTLTGLNILTTTDAWAVGSYYIAPGQYRPLIEHWDGTRWRVSSSWSPAVNSGLSDVVAFSASNAWAVGSTTRSDGGIGNTLVEHWNGTEWSRIASTNPGGADGSELTGMGAGSPSNIWAVGDNAQGGSEGHTLVEHWGRGSRWSHIASPTPGGFGDTLSAVDVDTVSDVWAVGSNFSGAQPVTLVEHWNGHQWATVASPSPDQSSLTGVSAVSATDAWAVGFDFAGGSAHTLIEHWDGSTWTQV
jgi:hypothetical protein